MVNKDRIIVKLAKNRKYYWNFVAPNGKVLATSELYSSKRSCLRSVSALVWRLSPNVVLKVDD